MAISQVAQEPALAKHTLNRRLKPENQVRAIDKRES
ncbi:uncharacterized protein METZ01_LOCUS60035 [marine metagenome]|uniref:Uncharacterized protein n=1 Tax=marine metagenome TaxID=408172 RepID=A0A381SV54_9ZZZZ